MGSASNRRAAAQELARHCFSDAKAWARHAYPTAARLAAMRNAWAAFHADSEWMDRLRADCYGWCASGREVGAENARLRAEVERLRSGITAKRAAFNDRRMLHHDSPEAAHECALAIAALDALTRENGEG